MVPFSEIFGDSAFDPIPKGFLLDDLAIALRIDGTDPATGILGDDLKAQIANAYSNLQCFVDSCGASLANVAQVSFFFHGVAQPALVNDQWVEMFPDPSDRPTYKFMPASFTGQELIRLEAFIVPNARRQVVAVDGVAHTNPIPMAVRIGRYLFTSRLLPYDPVTQEPAETLEEQARFVFQHANTVLDRARMDWSNVVQGRSFFAEDIGRKILEDQWHRQFSEEHSSPPLHPVRYQAGKLLAMLELIAVTA